MVVKKKQKINNSFDHPIFIYLKVEKKMSSLVNAWCKLIALLQMFRCCEILLRKQVNHENVWENSSQKPRQLKYIS